MIDEQLTEILNKEVAEVLKDKRLLLSMLRIYSQLFLNSKPCSTCESKHKGYYKRLQREGPQALERLKKRKMGLTKFKINNEYGVFSVRGERFTAENLTDEKLEKILKEFPALEKQVKRLEEPKKEKKSEEPKEVEQKDEQKTKKTRKPRAKKAE